MAKYLSPNEKWQWRNFQPKITPLRPLLHQIECAIWKRRIQNMNAFVPSGIVMKNRVFKFMLFLNESWASRKVNFFALQNFAFALSGSYWIAAPSYIDFTQACMCLSCGVNLMLEVCTPPILPQLCGRSMKRQMGLHNCLNNSICTCEWMNSNLSIFSFECHSNDLKLTNVRLFLFLFCERVW